MTSVNVKVWGAGGGGGEAPTYGGGGGGFSSGTLAVTGGQTLRVISGLGGQRGGISGAVTQFLNGGLSAIVPGAGPAGPQAGAGGGLSGVFNADLVPLSAPQYSAPQAYIIAGSGGGGSGRHKPDNSPAGSGTANRGGGGGGIRHWNGAAGSGGSGRVVIAYPGTSPKGSGGTQSIVGSNRVHSFNSPGTYTS